MRKGNWWWEGIWAALNVAVPLAVVALMLWASSSYATGGEQQTVAAQPEGLWEWALALLKQLVTVNVAWVIVSLAIGLLVAVGAAEVSKRYKSLFPPHGNWDVRAQLVAGFWGTIVTGLLIWGLTTWPAKGQAIAVVCIAPLVFLWAGKAYDVLWRLFPVLMDKATKKLSGSDNVDV